MTSHNFVPVVAVGGSAGSLPPLLSLVEQLPPDFAAALLVCQHTPEHSRSRLPEILQRRGRLPAAWASDREPLDAGRIYVAPPGRHLMLSGHTARLSPGPQVNRHRPSVDVLFASVAQTLGPAGTVVVLSGVLDDGAVGAALVAQGGGQVLVQTPSEAEFDGMPAAALTAAPEARVTDGRALGKEIVSAVARAAGREDRRTQEADVDVEPMMSDSTEADPVTVFPQRGEASRLVCPDCGGSMAQIDLPRISYFRCHVGHQYSPESLVAAQGTASEDKLWSALAALEEQALLLRQLSDHRRPSYLAGAAAGDGAGEVERRAAILRRLLQDWVGEPS